MTQTYPGAVVDPLFQFKVIIWQFKASLEWCIIKYCFIVLPWLVNWQTRIGIAIGKKGSLPRFSKTHHMSDKLTLLPFIVGTVGTGLVSGYMNRPGPWYSTLKQPPLEPPRWLFAPVWTTLYVLIAIAGWRTWERRRESPEAWKYWMAQMVVNFAWSPTFFRAQSLTGGLVVVFGLLGTIIMYMRETRKTDPTSFWLFVPYLCWATFATYLTVGLNILN